MPSMPGSAAAPAGRWHRPVRRRAPTKVARHEAELSAEDIELDLSDPWADCRVQTSADAGGSLKPRAAPVVPCRSYESLAWSARFPPRKGREEGRRSRRQLWVGYQQVLGHARARKCVCGGGERERESTMLLGALVLGGAALAEIVERPVFYTLNDENNTMCETAHIHRGRAIERARERERARAREREREREREKERDPASQSDWRC